jgi:hypothetical protein
MRVAHEIADQRGIALGEHQRATETVDICREREDLCHLGRLPIEVPGQLRRPGSRPSSNPSSVLARRRRPARSRTWRRSRIVRAWLAMVRPIAWLNQNVA